ncbi:MAG: hypothetical protein RJA36_3944 [Pseudomonadota bacterium]
MIADPNDGRRACGNCWHMNRCPTPQACEQAEQERVERASRRDLLVAAALLVAVLGTLLILNWRP